MKIKALPRVQMSTIEELTEEMRVRWARNFVDDGGPVPWIDRITKMGREAMTSFSDMNLSYGQSSQGSSANGERKRVHMKSCYST